MFIRTFSVPRKSIVEEILEDHPSWEVDVKIIYSSYVVFYGFNGNPSHRFYKALEKLRESITFTHPRKGVLITMKINNAYTISRLITYYGGWVDVAKTGEFDFERVFDEYR